MLVFPTKILAAIEAFSNDPVDRENVSNHIYEHPEKYKIGHLPCPVDLQRPEIRLTIDELPDFQFVTKIFEALRPGNHFFDTKDIIQLIDHFTPSFQESIRRSDRRY